MPDGCCGMDVQTGGCPSRPKGGRGDQYCNITPMPLIVPSYLHRYRTTLPDASALPDYGVYSCVIVPDSPTIGPARVF